MYSAPLHDVILIEARTADRRRSARYEADRGGRDPRAKAPRISLHLAGRIEHLFHHPLRPAAR